MNIKDINLNSLNVNSFFFNYLNIIFDHLKSRNDEIKVRIINLIETINTDLIALFVVIFLISILSLFIFSFLMMAIKTEREGILFLFLDINQSYVQVLYRKCENFLSSYVSMKTLIAEYEDDDIYESSSEEDDQEANLVYLNNDLDSKHEDDEEENERNLKLKKIQNRKKMLKKYKANILKEYRKLILRFLIYAVLIQVYSLFNLIGMVNLQGSLSFLFPQLFQYSYYPTVYTYTYNLQRTMLIDYNYKINNKSAYEFAKYSLLPFYNIDREINDVIKILKKKIK